MLLRLSILSAVESRIEHMIENQSGEVSAGMLPDPAPLHPGLPGRGLLDSTVVAGWVRALASLGDPDSLPGSTDGSAHIGSYGNTCVVSDAERVEQLAVLERLKAAAAAAQARVTVGFDASHRAAQRAAGLPERRVGAGIAAQVGLARRDSPVRGARHLGLARALVGELPHTLAALSAGETSEWRATLIARETACLSRADRAPVDAELAARPGGIGALGDREAAAEARRIGYRLDPHALTDRAARAHSERRVTLRPAPDTMACLSGLLPAVQGVAVYAALTRHADTLRSDRGRPQPRPDHGRHPRRTRHRTDHRRRGPGRGPPRDDRHHPARHRTRPPAPTTRQASGRVDVPAHLEGYGPLPAPWVRDWLRDTDAQVWLRRLYTSPETGQLVAMDSRRRRFTGQLRRFVVLRDQHCRTPWCNAPIRHVDHPRPRGRRRTHQHRERPRPLRGLQLRQGSPRLDHPDHHQPTAAAATRAAGGRDHHPHRTPPPHPTTPATRPHPTTPHHPTPPQPRRDLLPPRPARRPRVLRAQPGASPSTLSTSGQAAPCPASNQGPCRNTWPRGRLGTRSDT